MHVFIDTNIFLDFYRLSSGDLEELRKIAKLAETRQITLYLSDFLIDEYLRNRESTISQAVSQFEKSKVDLHLPNIVRMYDEAFELQETKKQFNTQFKALKEKLIEEIKQESLKADEVINEVFSSTEKFEVQAATITSALLRSRLGKPPGKKDSNGDSIHWEWLLNQVPSNTELFIISGDGDFESEVLEGTIKSYLREEWDKKKGGRVYLFKSLTDFIGQFFSHIELADEIEKKAAIEGLIKSPNFVTTHHMINKLDDYEDFSASEIQELLSAFALNNQITWILGDHDIQEFAHKLVTYAYDADLENDAFFLEELLNELELSKINSTRRVAEKLGTPDF